MVAKGMNVNPDLCACNIDAKGVSAVPINTNMTNLDGTPPDSNSYDSVSNIEFNVGTLEASVMNDGTTPESINNISFMLRKLINESYPDNSKQKDDWMERLDNVDKYNTTKMRAQQQKTLDTLTVISVIFLPLTLIVAYFGMNFKTMKIYTTKQPHRLVLTLLALAIVIVIFLFRAGVLSA